MKISQLKGWRKIKGLRSTVKSLFRARITAGIWKQRQKRRAKTGVRKKLSGAIQILAATF
jgi:hypothetical protein